MQENNNTEFKREFVDEIKKTVIAFANTAGGKIYIGIDDDGRTVGVSDPHLKLSETPSQERL